MEISKRNPTKLCQTEEVNLNGHDARRIRWRRVVNVNVTIEIRSLCPVSPKTFYVSDGTASGGLQWQDIVNRHIF